MTVFPEWGSLQALNGSRDAHGHRPEGFPEYGGCAIELHEVASDVVGRKGHSQS